MFGLHLQVCLVLSGLCVAWTVTTIPYSFHFIPRADMFAIDKDTRSVIVGGRGQIVELSMNLSTVIQKTTIRSLADSPELDELDQCRRVLMSQGKGDKVSYYCFFDATLVLLPGEVSPGSDLEDTVLVCSTTYTVAVCANRKRSNFSEVVQKQEVGEDYSSLYVDVPSQAFISSDGNFWGLSADHSKLSLKRSTFGLSNDDTVWIKSDKERLPWFNGAGYGNIVEVGDYVYAFFWERALETDNWRTVARVARVCKNDSGIRDNRISSQVFSSFVKVQISCNSTSAADPSASRIYPYVVDAYYIEDGNLQPGSPQGYFYAVFQASSPLDDTGPTGSALCVFDYNTVESALNSLELVNLDSVTDVNVNEPIDCESSGTRDIAAATSVTLSKDVVKNEETVLGKPLHLLADGERFTRLVVDEITALDGNSYEVVFVLSTHKFFDKLYLYKLSYNFNRRQNSKVNYKVSLTEDSSQLMDDTNTYGTYRPHFGKRMELFKDGEDTWLYVTSEAGIFRLRTDECSQYTTCGDCLAAADPHCAFDNQQLKCVSVLKSTNRTVLTQSLQGRTDSCPGVTGGTTATTVPTVTTAPTSVDSLGSTEAPTPAETPGNASTNNNTTNVDSDPLNTGPTSDTKTEWWPLGVGIAVGLFVGIIVGIFVSLFWTHRVAIKKARSKTFLPVYSHAAGCNKREKNGHVATGGGLSEKPNNVVDPEEYHRKDSPPLKEDYHNFSLSRPNAKGDSCDPILRSNSEDKEVNDVSPNVRRSHSQEPAIIQMPQEPNSSDSAVSLQEHDPNLANSSPNSPGSPVTNMTWNMYQTNLVTGSNDVDGDYKLSHPPVSTGTRRPKRLSQVSLGMNGSYLNDPGIGCSSPSCSIKSGPSEVFSYIANSPGSRNSYSQNEATSTPVGSAGNRSPSRTRRSSLLFTRGKTKASSCESYDC